MLQIARLGVRRVIHVSDSTLACPTCRRYVGPGRGGSHVEDRRHADRPARPDDEPPARWSAVVSPACAPGSQDRLWSARREVGRRPRATTARRSRPAGRSTSATRGSTDGTCATRATAPGAIASPGPSAPTAAAVGVVTDPERGEQSMSVDLTVESAPAPPRRTRCSPSTAGATSSGCSRWSSRSSQLGRAVHWALPVGIVLCAVAVLTAWPPVRRAVGDRMRSVVVQHRLRSAFHELALDDLGGPSAGDRLESRRAPRACGSTCCARPGSPPAICMRCGSSSPPPAAPPTSGSSGTRGTPRSSCSSW